MLADAKPIRLTRAFGEAGKRVNGLSVEHWSRGRSLPTARRFLARKLASYRWFTRSMSPFPIEVGVAHRDQVLDHLGKRASAFKPAKSFARSPADRGDILLSHGTTPVVLAQHLKVEDERLSAVDFFLMLLVGCSHSSGIYT